MRKVNIGYIPVSKSSFDTKWAEEISRLTYNMLISLNNVKIIKSDVVLTSIELGEIINNFKKEQVDIILIHLCTFCFGNIVPDIVTNLKVPAILLSLPDPKFDGGKIRSNSFCALNMNSHTLYKMDIKYRPLFTTLENNKLLDDIKKIIMAIYMDKNLNNKKIGLVGSRVPGFYTSNFDELKLRKELGIEIEYIDISRVCDYGKNISKKEIAFNNNYIRKFVRDINEVDYEDYDKLVRVFSSLLKIIEHNRIDALAIKCWPEFMEDYGIAICPVLGLLNTYGIPTACEGDIYGAVTMMLQKYISGKTPFFSDFIYLDSYNTGLFWHCGSAPCDLAKSKSEITIRKYPKIQKNVRENGCIFNFSINAKNKKISISRFGTDKYGNYRILNIKAVGKEVEEIIRGNTCKLEFLNSIELIKNIILDNGFEHHYSLVLSDIAEELEEFSFWKDIKFYQC